MRRSVTGKKYRDKKTENEALANHLTVLLYQSNEIIADKYLKNELFENTKVSTGTNDIHAEEHFHKMRMIFMELKSKHELEYIKDIQKRILQDRKNPDKENYSVVITPDLSFTDSVTKYGFFRAYLHKIRMRSNGKSVN